MFGFLGSETDLSEESFRMKVFIFLLWLSPNSKFLRVGVEMKLLDLQLTTNVAELTYRIHCLKKRATAIRE